MSFPEAFAPHGHLAQVLSPTGGVEAIGLLRDYFTPLGQGGRFEGGAFERFLGGGDSPDVKDKFTAADVVAVTMLSVSVPPASSLRLLETDASRFNALLAKIPVGAHFEDLETSEVADSAWEVRTLYNDLITLNGVAETTATKLLARKRPHLVPIIDSVVRMQFGRRSGPLWASLHGWLTADNASNATRLRELGDSAGLADISILRVFDVLAWRTGSGKVGLGPLVG